MNYVYSSPFRDDILGLIREKLSLGYVYGVDCKHLRHFDRYCVNNHSHATMLSKDIVMDWAQAGPTEHAGGLGRRLICIRELARYIQRQGRSAYVLPTNIVKRASQYIPHIFTDTELRAFFHAADQFPSSKLVPTRHYVIPVVFRVLYCCGLRPSEAAKLKVEDVDIQTGRLFIRESKGHKDRIVVMSDDLLMLCRKYREKIRLLVPQSRYFFPSGDTYYSHHWLYTCFWDCWNLAGIREFGGNRPRVYDFRHTFATRCLFRWMKEGKDIRAWMPYLSAYLGHEYFEDTAYYLHLVPEFFSQLPEETLQQFEYLLPEVAYES